MSTKLAMTRDINGFNTFGLAFCENKWSATLAGAATPLTVPSNFPNWLAVFYYEPGTRVWVANNATATVPAGATLAVTNSSLNPPPREVKAGDVLSFITPDTSADLGIELYVIE